MGAGVGAALANFMAREHLSLRGISFPFPRSQPRTWPRSAWTRRSRPWKIQSSGSKLLLEAHLFVCRVVRPTNHRLLHAAMIDGEANARVRLEPDSLLNWAPFGRRVGNKSVRIGPFEREREQLYSCE